MQKKEKKGLLKHLDFIILDILCLQVCFVLAFWINGGRGNPYGEDFYRNQAVILFACQLAVDIFSYNYKNILRRKRTDELIKVVQYMATILVIAMIGLFLTHTSARVSRMQFGITSVLFVVLGFGVRHLNKKIVLRRSKNGDNRGKRSIVLITSGDLVRDAMKGLMDTDLYRDYFISGIVLLDGTDPEEFQDLAVPMFAAGDDIAAQLGREWVDEVFIFQPDTAPYPTQLVERLMDMGITVNYTLSVLNTDLWAKTDIRKLGRYKVLTNSIRFVPADQMAFKRLIDVAGGLVGCLFTGILFLFIAPLIERKSPGPVFFAQERVGRNGKIFKMYKFRSMYLDAEERKAALMAENKIQDGMMFKMDDDPRIIGSERKDKNGKPRGIGNFIRNTSLDEFPQFWNVLKGDMSLVGTRPPTLDEWNKYDIHHRVRMSIKPGITGLWQVSGRSDITDFEEVVRLDKEYIENWSFALDLKILLKTVAVVLGRKGAE